MTACRKGSGMKLLLPLLLVSSSAFAVELEAELGHTSYQRVGNGVWYQQDRPHSLDLKDHSIGVSARWSINSWLDWRLGYVRLGSVRTDALATPEDSNYDFENKVCKNPCLPLARFMGAGSAQGLTLTLQPTYRHGKFSAFIEGGVTYFRVKWDMYIQYDPEYIYYHTKPAPPVGAPTEGYCKVCFVDSWGFGRRLGAGFSYQKVAITYSYFDKLSVRGDDPDNGVPVFDAAHQVALRISF